MPYTQLGWAEIEGAGAVDLPHLIRDWYARTWFDWHLKGDGRARQRLRAGDPFGALTSVRSDIRQAVLLRCGGGGLSWPTEVLPFQEIAP